jgi:hypothetical protein
MAPAALPSVACRRRELLPLSQYSTRVTVSPTRIAPATQRSRTRRASSRCAQRGNEAGRSYEVGRLDETSASRTAQPFPLPGECTYRTRGSRPATPLRQAPCPHQCQGRRSGGNAEDRRPSFHTPPPPTRATTWSEHGQGRRRSAAQPPPATPPIAPRSERSKARRGRDHRRADTLLPREHHDSLTLRLS